MVLSGGRGGVGGGAVHGVGAVQGVLSITGSDIITPLPPVDKQTGVKTLPCPKLRLRPVNDITTTVRGTFSRFLNCTI